MFDISPILWGHLHTSPFPTGLDEQLQCFSISALVRSHRHVEAGLHEGDKILPF